MCMPCTAGLRGEVSSLCQLGPAGAENAVHGRFAAVAQLVLQASLYG